MVKSRSSTRPAPINLMSKTVAATPALRLMRVMPLPVELPFFRPADWASIGENLAQDTRCAAVGKTAMSVPSSAMIS